AQDFKIELSKFSLEDDLVDLLNKLYKALGPIVILIYNFDKPIFKSLEDTETLFQIRDSLKLFYDIIDSYNYYLRFIMIVGEERYQKNGVFSTLQNIIDISQDKEYFDLLGYTQLELEKYFNDLILINAKNLNISYDECLKKLKEYNHEFDFGVKDDLYHPKALMQCLRSQKLENYSQYINNEITNIDEIYTCLNPGDSGFLKIKDFLFYVDKSELLIYTNKFINTDKRYICISRPRRFGKTTAANMVASYYDHTGQAEKIFKNLKITHHPSFKLHANKYIVIKLNIQNYLSQTHDIDLLLEAIKNSIYTDLIKQYDKTYSSFDLNNFMKSITAKTGRNFIMVLDEWDCILREFKDKEDWQRKYLDFLRYLFKDQDHLALVYMTGILPIKKYGTHSALNMFDEYSMLAANPFTEFMGFTESEVKDLCLKYQLDFSECKRWYDGYQIQDLNSIYNPKSVNSAINSHEFANYWNRTETYEALRCYITYKNFDLHETITKLLANESIKINTGTFSNDMKSFHSKDDILTLLVHLGYLSFDYKTSTVRIPNKEISAEFVQAIQIGGWPEVIKAIENSQKLLRALLNKDSQTVAEGVAKAHEEISILTYNDENSLACTLSLAFYAAREHYTLVREFPTGQGFADLVFLPKPNCVDPILVIELKWNKSAKAAIDQIKERNYPSSLTGIRGSILLVGINYTKKTKKHTCKIETFQL
ncbi:MAG: AAA family ATPase, partial [Desulfovibrionaceae bacterium]|nr:AAA family ATPase [Desulfovibrionaceae bacterium]